MKMDLGATRRVFIFKNFVVKIPNTQEYKLFICGILANLQEKLWSGCHPDLAKVLWCSPLGLVLIMERAITLSTDELREFDWLKFKEDLEEKYKDDDLGEFMLSDTKPDNWGYVGDRLVKIDYGN